ncbi:MAG: hypothetical protein MAG715_00473 [Methanonatronarchaeales archaeon]|nr:hypothetical protein [Methanonatronarchaeales archaeon]
MAYTLKGLYEFFVEMGIENDPRGRGPAERALDEAGEAFEELDDDEREYFDEESLRNPYSDTRILNGDPDTEVERVLIGIDIGVGELVLSDRLRERGERIDAVVAHHPEGSALARLYDVMDLQTDLLHDVGVPIAVAEKLMKKRMGEVERGVLPANHFQAVDAARLLDVPFMCVHTASDNQVATHLQSRMDEAGPQKVEDVIDVLEEEPEYRLARKQDTGLKVTVGSEDARAGKVFVDMTGGTSGSKEVYEHLADRDIGTVVGMHMKEEYREKAEENHVNVVIAAHDMSDALGMNLLLDAANDEDDLDVVECSGFRRFERT